MKKRDRNGEEQKRRTFPVLVTSASENAPGSVLLLLAKPEGQRQSKVSETNRL